MGRFEQIKADVKKIGDLDKGATKSLPLWMLHKRFGRMTKEQKESLKNEL